MIKIVSNNGPREIRQNYCGQPKLGVGTIWMGRRWPIDNKNYVYPAQEEAFAFLEKAYGAGIRMFDTAAAYGGSEEVLGSFFKTHPECLKDSFIATKWGEDFDLKTEKSTVDNSLENLRRSFLRSSGFLPRIDLLYFHKPNIEVLSSNEIREEFNKLKASGKISFSGISISDPTKLLGIVDAGLLWTDFLQVPAQAALQNENAMFKLFAEGKIIVVNAPARYAKAVTVSIEKTYKKLALRNYVYCVLTGTRNHLDETVGYFLTMKKS